MEFGRNHAHELQRRRLGVGAALSPLERGYAEAWDRYEARCLWNIRRAEKPTADDARIVAACLRENGDMEARRLASRIEDACRAAH